MTFGDKPRAPHSMKRLALVALAALFLNACGSDSSSVRVVQNKIGIGGPSTCDSIPPGEKGKLEVQAFTRIEVSHRVGSYVNDARANGYARKLMAYCRSHGEETIHEATKRVVPNVHIPPPEFHGQFHDCRDMHEFNGYPDEAVAVRASGMDCEPAAGLIREVHGPCKNYKPCRVAGFACWSGFAGGSLVAIECYSGERAVRWSYVGY